MLPSQTIIFRTWQHNPVKRYRQLLVIKTYWNKQTGVHWKTNIHQLLSHSSRVFWRNFTCGFGTKIRLFFNMFQVFRVTYQNPWVKSGRNPRLVSSIQTLIQSGAYHSTPQWHLSTASSVEGKWFASCSRKHRWFFELHDLKGRKSYRLQLWNGCKYPVDARLNPLRVATNLTKL